MFEVSQTWIRNSLADIRKPEFTDIEVVHMRCSACMAFKETAGTRAHKNRCFFAKKRCNRSLVTRRTKTIIEVTTQILTLTCVLEALLVQSEAVSNIHEVHTTIKYSMWREVRRQQNVAACPMEWHVGDLYDVNMKQFKPTLAGSGPRKTIYGTIATRPAHAVDLQGTKSETKSMWRFFPCTKMYVGGLSEYKMEQLKLVLASIH